MTRISTGRRALAMTGAALAVTLTVALGACSTGSDDATAPTAPVAEATPGADEATPEADRPAVAESDDAAEPAPEPEAPVAEEAAPAPEAAETPTEAPAPAPAPAPAANGVISRAEAEAIAVSWVGSGRVTWVEREDDHGAAWEIEVTRPNGSEIDVYVAADGRVLNR